MYIIISWLFLYLCIVNTILVLFYNNLLIWWLSRSFSTWFFTFLCKHLLRHTFDIIMYRFLIYILINLFQITFSTHSLLIIVSSFTTLYFLNFIIILLFFGSHTIFQYFLILFDFSLCSYLYYYLYFYVLYYVLSGFFIILVLCLQFIACF